MTTVETRVHIELGFRFLTLPAFKRSNRVAFQDELERASSFERSKERSFLAQIIAASLNPEPAAKVFSMNGHATQFGSLLREARINKNRSPFFAWSFLPLLSHQFAPGLLLMIRTTTCCVW
jgi:hypothetical protein